MATKKRKGQGADKARSEKTAEVQTGHLERCEGVEGGRGTAGEGRREAAPRPIVAIGSSAGGLEALQEFFSNVPPDSGIAFVVVTHMRPGCDSILPELIGAVTRMEAIHAGDRTEVEPNKILVARDSLLSISKGALRPAKADDMNNLLNSMQVATIFLDTKLRVMRYTEQARDVARLIGSDIGRPLSDLTSNLRYDSLIEDCERVLTTLIPIEKEVQNASGRWHLVRLIPYRTAENVIEGLVMTTVDIDRTKRAEVQVKAERNYAEAVVRAARDPLVVLGADLRVQTANDAFYKTFKVTPDITEGRLIYDLGNRQWDIPLLRHLLEEIIPHISPIWKRWRLPLLRSPCHSGLSGRWDKIHQPATPRLSTRLPSRSHRG